MESPVTLVTRLIQDTLGYQAIQLLVAIQGQTLGLRVTQGIRVSLDTLAIQDTAACLDIRVTAEPTSNSR